MVSTDTKNKATDACVIAINNRGEVGAASMRARFHLKYAVWRDGQSQLFDSVVLY